MNSALAYVIFNDCEPILNSTKYAKEVPEMYDKEENAIYLYSDFWTDLAS